MIVDAGHDHVECILVCICPKCFSIGHGTQTRKQVEKKWASAKSEGKRKRLKNATLTGNTTPEKLNAEEQYIMDKLDAIGSATVDGIPGGIESLVSYILVLVLSGDELLVLLCDCAERIPCEICREMSIISRCFANKNSRDNVMTVLARASLTEQERNDYHLLAFYRLSRTFWCRLQNCASHLPMLQRVETTRRSSRRSLTRNQCPKARKEKLVCMGGCCGPDRRMHVCIVHGRVWWSCKENVCFSCAGDDMVGQENAVKVV